MSPYDVVVVGGGNAALCAAIEAAERGARVIILESAPPHMRGGNSRHTRNFRCMHHGPLSVLSDTYGEDEYYDDLLRVTKGKTDPDLARLTIRHSEACLPWMEEHGVIFQSSLSGTLSLERTNAFFLGGGKALVNAYYACAEDLGVTIRYNAEVRHVDIQDGRFEAVILADGSRIEGHAAVLASGGFQADLDWLTRAWGPEAENFLIRGTPYNKGVILRDVLDQGAQSVGDPTQCHCVAIDGRAPKFDGGIVTRRDCVPYALGVNRQGQRFYDEGEDVWPKRYAIWGRLVAAQPDQIAYALIDAKAQGLFMPPVFEAVQADSLEDLAQALDLPAKTLVETVTRYNAACREGPFTPGVLDGVATEGLDPPKTNWARPLDTPPYACYMLRPGVTFTYLGLKVSDRAQVQGATGPLPNVWAAGEIMAGSILGQGYLAGFGMTIGTVFGRIAGQEAAAYAR